MSKKQLDASVISVNKKARFAYQIVETFEAGIELEGWEVKSLRAKQTQINDSFVKARGGELWVIGMLITPLVSRSTHVTTPSDKTRRLLLHKKEINKLTSIMREQRMTCVVTKMYWQKRFVKCAIALAKGKQQHDKRQTIKERQWQREQGRTLKRNWR